MKDSSREVERSTCFSHLHIPCCLYCQMSFKCFVFFRGSYIICIYTFRTNYQKFNNWNFSEKWKVFGQRSCIYKWVPINGYLTEIYLDKIINFLQQGRQKTLFAIIKKLSRTRPSYFMHTQISTQCNRSFADFFLHRGINHFIVIAWCLKNEIKNFINDIKYACPLIKSLQNLGRIWNKSLYPDNFP